MYSIAHRYELNWREVASWNNIPPPYTLSPGQILSLERYPVVPYSQRGSKSASGTVNNNPSSARPPPAAAPTKSTTGKIIPRRKPLPVIVRDTGKNWRWPADGRILRTYEQTEPRHGIDIGGALGSSVVAAENGRVVYSGSGLKGYGKLVIIKHDERFLTAYSFNRRLLVEQGDTVKAGQQIAEMGKGPHNESMLHFELRQDGEPVDPTRLLPAR